MSRGSGRWRGGGSAVTTSGRPEGGKGTLTFLPATFLMADVGCGCVHVSYRMEASGTGGQPQGAEMKSNTCAEGLRLQRTTLAWDSFLWTSFT